MNTKKCYTVTSILIIGLFASAEPIWHDNCLLPETLLLNEKNLPEGCSLLPPTDPADLSITTNLGGTGCEYRSARSLCWSPEYENYYQHAPIYVVASSQVSSLPANVSAPDNGLHIWFCVGDWQNVADNCYTTPSQIAYILYKHPESFGLRSDASSNSIALCMYANAKNCGGGTFWDKDPEKTAAAQEETEIKNLPGIFPRVASEDLVKKGSLIPQYVEPLYNESTKIFRTIAVGRHPMNSYTAISASGIPAVHGQMLRNYVQFEGLVPVDVIFTAAPDWRSKVANVTVDYINCILSMIQSQILALSECRSDVFITGPIGCGVFANDPRVVALAYAYALRYQRPDELRNVIFCGDSNFYQFVKEYYGKLGMNFPGRIPTTDELFHTFFPREEDQQFLWPSTATKDPLIRKLFQVAIPDTIKATTLDAARIFLMGLLGAPDPNFVCLHAEAYGCGRMLGTTILHAFAWAREPFVLLALCRYYGFDINQLNNANDTPFDVYVRRIGNLRHSNPARPIVENGLKALIRENAKCNKPDNCRTLNNRLSYYFEQTYPLQTLLLSTKKLATPPQGTCFETPPLSNNLDMRRSFNSFGSDASAFTSSALPYATQGSECLGPSYPTRNIYVNTLFGQVNRGVEGCDSLEEAMRFLIPILGFPNSDFASHDNAYGHCNMIGTTILHTCGWAYKPFLLLALCRYYGFDINYPNSAGYTPLDVYAECCGPVTIGSKKYKLAQAGLKALMEEGAKCNQPHLRAKLDRLLGYFSLLPKTMHEQSLPTYSTQQPTQFGAPEYRPDWDITSTMPASYGVRMQTIYQPPVINPNPFQQSQVQSNVGGGTGSSWGVLIDSIFRKINHNGEFNAIPTTIWDRGGNFWMDPQANPMVRTAPSSSNFPYSGSGVPSFQGFTTTDYGSPNGTGESTFSSITEDDF